MTEVRTSIEIGVRPQRVWEFVMDPRCLREWVHIHDGLKDAPDGQLREGSTFRQRLRLAGVPFTVRWEVESLQPPHQATWQGAGPARSRARVRYELEPTERGTSFCYVNEFHMPFRVATGAANSVLKSGPARREAERSLHRLKAVLEG